MEGEKKRDLAALREAGLAKDPNWKPWRDPVFTERLYREDYAPGSAGQNGALETAVDRLIKATLGLVERDLSFVGNSIVIPTLAHSEGIRRIRELREAAFAAIEELR